jgi:hypothetical protein
MHIKTFPDDKSFVNFQNFFEELYIMLTCIFVEFIRNYAWSGESVIKSSNNNITKVEQEIHGDHYVYTPSIALTPIPENISGSSHNLSRLFY